ncbi:unnamed protein product [marine sediment metagenome]|uniref:ABC transporter domain-containing protein n=1 Tax=marine sediment metagenome TaxID=412755 RepID=X1B4S5_9ZZZZ
MAIKIKNLSYSYSGEKKEALKNINIDIFDGQLCGVLGRNIKKEEIMTNILLPNKYENIIASNFIFTTENSHITFSPPG